MKNIVRFKFSASILTMLLVLLSGCSKHVQKSAASEDFLKYKFEENTTNKFMAKSNMSQIIVFGGQEISADIETLLSYSVTKTGENEDIIDLTIRIDSLYNRVRSAQGNMISTPEEVKNAEFTMKLSTNGKESGLAEAGNIEYTGVTGEKANLKNSFSYIFPDLPATAVNIGYTWVDNDTIDLSAGSQTVLMILNLNNTITAREKYNGYDCYRIEYTVKGERNASGDTPQGFMSQSGDLSGKGYMYYAIKEGLIVKEHNEQKLEGDLVIPTGESLPMYMDIIIDSELQK
jgi:hypothetical protein